MKNVVVIGGGHGQSTILKGIKDLKDVNISTIVTVADDGGSTGRLRAMYDVPAMGDIRNVLVALSKSDNFLTSLMDFRFSGEEETDVVGHNLGNLILTALTQMRGSFVNAIEETSTLMEVKGEVVPSSLEVISLYAIMDDDTIVKGEANIPSFNHHIKKVFYDHEVKAYDKAIQRILEADLIIYGIGSVYTSILPNIIIPDIQKALKETRATKVYFANCMTQNNETFDYDLKDHIDALESHGAIIDLVVKHKEVIPFYILSRYLKQNSVEVLDKGVDKKVLSYDLLDFSKGLVRHDSEKIKKVVEELLERYI